MSDGTRIDRLFYTFGAELDGTYEPAVQKVTRDLDKLGSQQIDIRISVDAAKATTGLAATEKAVKSTADATEGLIEKFKGLAVAAVSLKVIGVAKDVLDLGARYDTLGVSLDVVAKNLGKTRSELDETVNSLQKNGISMLESRQQTLRLAQAKLDLSQADKLARIAQDAAVIGNINSSQAFATLIHGIQSGQTDVLRTIGINVNFEASYKKLAKQLGVTTASLSEQQRMQARSNAVMEQGGTIAGTYDASLKTAGKQLQSTKRYLENVEVAVGKAFQPQYASLVFLYANALKFAGANVGLLVQAITGLIVVTGGRFLSKGIALLADYGAGLLKTRAASIATAEAEAASSVVTLERAEVVAQANRIEVAAAQARLAAAENALRANVALGASYEVLAGLAQNVVNAETRVAFAMEAAAVSTTAAAVAAEAATAATVGVATATAALPVAMTAAGTGAARMWALIGGPIGAIVIGIYGVYTVLKKFENDALAKAEARTAAVRAETEKYALGLAGMSVQALKAAEATERLNAAQAAQRLAEASLTVVAARKRTDTEVGRASAGSPKAYTDAIAKAHDELAPLEAAYTKALSEAEVAAGRVSAVVAALKPAAEKGLGAVADEADKADKKFEQLIESAKDFAGSLGGNGDPVGIAKAKVAALTEEINKQIPKLDKAKQAAARIEAGTIFDQMRLGLDRVQVSEIDKLNEKLDKFRKALEKDAIGTAGDAFKELAKAARDAAEEATKMAASAGDASARQTFEAQAKVARNYADALDNEADALVEAAAFQSEYTKAIDVAIEARAGFNAAVTDTKFTLDEYNQSVDVLRAAEIKLRAQSQDLTLSWEARTKAGEELLKVQNALNGTSTTSATKPADDAILLAGALQTASNNAAEMARNLGEAGNKLAQMASVGIKVANVIKAIQAAQQAAKLASASGNELSGAEKLANKTDWITLVVGLGVQLADAVDLFGTKAKKKAEQLRKDAIEFNQALADFARPVTEATFSDFEKSKAALYRETAGKIDIAAKDTGVTKDPSNATSAAGLRAYIKDIEAQFKALYKSGDRKDINRAFHLEEYAKALALVADTAEEREKALTAAHETEVRRNTEDLGVRALLSQGRNEEAEQLRTKLANERAIEEAAKDTTESGIAYYHALQKIVEGEDAAAEAVKRDPLKEFQNRAKLFGIAGAEYLAGLTQATAAKFADVGVALQGLDLATQEGLDALKARGKELYAQFLANDGFISESEQAILDGLFNIYSTAADVFDTIAERVNRALAKASEDNDVLGGDAKTRFGRTTAAAQGFSDVLDAIIGNLDLSSAAGADDAKAKLRAFYVDLATDGISEAEEPIVALIQTLLGGIGDVWDEELSKLDAQVEAAQNARAQKRADRSRYNQVNDKEGADAFLNDVSALPRTISKWFDEFNVRTEAGVDGAKQRLAELNDSIDALSDEQILARFGVTRDELTGIILDLDSGLDGLAQGFDAVADAATAAQHALADFVDSVNDDYLRASGKDREADLAQAKARTAEKLKTAKELGVSQADIDKIIATGVLTINAINKRYDDAAASATSNAAPASAGTGSGNASIDSQRNTFVASGVTSITELQALRITDYLAMIAVNTGYLKTLSASLAGGSALRIPNIAAASSSASTTTGRGGVTLNFYFTVQGDLSTRENAYAVAERVDQVLRLRVSGLKEMQGISR